MKYTDVPKPVEDIQAQIVAGQDLLRISRLSLKAANNNTLSVEGSVQKPLDEKARSLDITTKMNLDLATIKDFYPIDEDTLSMRGKLIADAVLKGKPDPEQIEKLLQRATVELRNGYISHRDLGKPIEDLTFLASASGSRLTIREARFKTGNNSLALTGNVDKYLSEEPILDVQINGDALLSDVSAYYSLEPWINQLNGEITLNLKAKGPAGDPVKLTLTGALELKNVSASGDSLPLPVTNMQGKLTVTPTELSLDRFSMNYGTSDFSLNGKVKNYLGFLEEHSSTSTMPIITGNYYSKKLNLDEMIDWEAETEDVPIPINLPKITGNFSARIDSLIAMEMNITQIQGNGRISPTEILLDQANARMYGGTAKGKMIWNAQNPERTKLTFNGSLDTLKAAEFLGGNALMGDGNQMGNHLTGKLSATVNYFTEFDIFINPDMGSTLADGSFGMADGRLKDHPMQKQLASLLKSPELQDVVLDEWLSTFTIKDTVMTIKNLKLTSKDVGMEINGTQHMVNDKIDYKANLFLPPKFKNTIASVISKQGADALSQKDGTLKVPLAITGTSENPKVAPDAKIVDDILKNFLKNEVGGAVRKLFGGGK